MGSKAIVTNEYYRITDNCVHPELYKTVKTYSEELYWKAMEIALERRSHVAIRRITEWALPISDEPNPYFSYSFKRSKDGKSYIGETETGYVAVGPAHFAKDTELSRYSPVNGLSVPTEIELGA